MVAISRRLIAGAVAGRLLPLTTGTAAAAGYLGQVGRGLDGTLGGEPQPKSKSDQRVRPYFIVFPGAGTPGPENDVGDSLIDLATAFQVTVAGGDIDDVLALTDRVHELLFRWAPGVLGTAPDFFTAGPLRVPPGYDPGPVRTDTGVKPQRLYVPLQYVLTAHT